ncbi:hypothetical protein MZM54_03610 [[Brevibacterium] frigoritolerans]|nr:hypothetical protein [Peribacillus frigoritolerans]
MMNFKPWYQIEYGYFAKQRFEGNMKAVEVFEFDTKTNRVYNGKNGTQFEDTIFRTSDKEVIKQVLSDINPTVAIDYQFNIENGILTERIDIVNDISKQYTLRSNLNVINQSIFLRHIFKMFGTYLTVFIKDHKYSVTGQEYILNEFRKVLEKHSFYTTGCGNYTFVRSQSKTEDFFLGIDAAFERNTANEMDQRKGITLFIYMDDAYKQSPLDNNFIVNEETAKLFANINNQEASICNGVLTSLQKAGIQYDLVYNYTQDYLGSADH